MPDNDLDPAALDRLNAFRNAWQLDHAPRRRPKLREFEGLDLRKRRRRQPRMLGTVARFVGEIR